jgi:DNA-binding GntR family transcriptional regulator
VEKKLELLADNKSEITFNKPKTIVETVTEFLRESIVAGSLRPGEKINSKEIIERLGISNIPFREAMRILEKEGLVITRPGRGSWVAGASRKDLKETFEIREMLETFAVDLLGKNNKADKDIKEKLKSIAVDEKTALSGPEGCVSFHDYLVQLAGNSKLSYAYYMTFNNIQRYQRLAYRIRQKEGLLVKEHVKEHLEILEALIKGDFEGAKLLIKSHLEKLEAMLLEQVDFSD